MKKEQNYIPGGQAGLGLLDTRESCHSCGRREASTISTQDLGSVSEATRSKVVVLPYMLRAERNLPSPALSSYTYVHLELTKL